MPTTKVSFLQEYHERSEGLQWITLKKSFAGDHCSSEVYMKQLQWPPHWASDPNAAFDSIVWACTS